MKTKKAINVPMPGNAFRKEELMKKIELLVFTMVLLLTLTSAGCASRKVVRPIAPPPGPSLGERLDQLYKNDPLEWKNQVKRHIAFGDPDIPSRHLVRAIKEFNDVKTKKDCLDAVYLYLDKEANKNGRFSPDDQRLFSSFVEYVLKNPDSSSMNNIKGLCRKVDDGVCQGLR